MLNTSWTTYPSEESISDKESLLNRPLFVIHIDDHSLFAQVVEKCINRTFPNADIINIQDGHRAFRLIKELNDDKLKVDLIITDINHPGLRGDELLLELRKLEERTHAARTSTMILSFVGEEYLSNVLAPGLNIVDRYLSKSAEAEDIVKAVGEILNSKSSLHIQE